MSNCNNCFGGCVETTSDQCVKYTGLPIAFLDIETGDPLSVIEDKIFIYLTTVLDGTGIVPDVDLGLCTLLTDSLPATPTITLNQLLTALATALCALQTQVTAVDAAITTIEQECVTDCLDGVTIESDTHDVLQAVIVKLCTAVTDLENLTADVETNYEKKVDLNNDIAAYLAGTTSTKMYNKMVPYSPIPYYGPLVNYPTTSDGFVTGIGFGAWEKVYLCNGDHGTPDLRGLAVVGAITDMGGGVLESNVLGLTYTLDDVIGESTVKLDDTTLPSHKHTATATDAGHTHFVIKNNTDNTYNLVSASNTLKTESYADAAYAYTLRGVAGPADVGLSSSGQANVSVAVNNFGGSGYHENTSPARVLYYIMYKP